MAASVTSLVRLNAGSIPCGVALVFACLANLAAGCGLFSSLTADPPEQCKHLPLALHIVAGEMINLSPTGQPTPLEVRALMLAERDLFDEADFTAIWRQPDETLESSLLMSKSMVAFPGQETIDSLKVPPQTAYLALVGLFRTPAKEEWGRVIDVRPLIKGCKPDQLHQIVRVEVTDNRISGVELMGEEAS